MQKQYNHLEHEKVIYSLWEKAGIFEAPMADDARKNGQKPFSIIMPPPNANDPLHVGHAMFISIEDILIRYNRMRGNACLWLPGTDHAGIETQYVFEKKLKKQNKSRFSYDRDTLFKLIWDYVQDNSGIAIDQMKQLGASADWSRQKFTLDTDIVDQVLTTFEKMHSEGLIYRGQRLVNYCTKCGTAYSELEVKHEDRQDPLYYMKYGPFTLATVRPETKFGDTAVAVHPDDARYKEMIGKEIEVLGLNGTIKMKVIADTYVNPEFGTGVVKVTPAHDPNDFAIWERHKDQIPGPKQVITFEGKMNKLAGTYAGLKVMEARERVVNDLKEKGLLEKIDTHYSHSVGVCYRCGNVIEPLPLTQFFLQVNTLTQMALKSLETHETTVIGSGHDKILRHWLNNLKDWNISRQIVWGIRIPVWYSIDQNPNIQVGFLDKDKKYVSGTISELMKSYDADLIEKNLQTLNAFQDARYVVSREKPGPLYLQETDTFDTWFSSSQWPVVTLKAARTGDFDYYYPTSVMETGYDILPFWVMRMMMMGIYLTGKSPFEKVYLHGLVRDEKGQKMSKSKGNVINPLELVQHYGADALRMALVMSTTAGKDSAVGENKVKGMRNFANKIWNAGRFLTETEKNSMIVQSAGKEDMIFIKEIDTIVQKTTQEMEALRIGQAAETVHNSFWHWFCDEEIEKCKRGVISLDALRSGYLTFLKLLQPFMPFLTETLYREIFDKDTLLASNRWPLD